MRHSRSAMWNLTLVATRGRPSTHPHYGIKLKAPSSQKSLGFSQRPFCFYETGKLGILNLTPLGLFLWWPLYLLPLSLTICVSAQISPPKRDLPSLFKVAPISCSVTSPCFISLIVRLLQYLKSLNLCTDLFVCTPLAPPPPRLPQEMSVWEQSSPLFKLLPYHPGPLTGYGTPEIPNRNRFSEKDNEMSLVLRAPQLRNGYTQRFEGPWGLREASRSGREEPGSWEERFAD